VVLVSSDPTSSVRVALQLILPIMSHDLTSEEVAEDYRRALEDLTMNSRYEISNLTVIAKENTEHALAISNALRDHIKRVRMTCHYFLLLSC
jgi:hypothetical protein